MFKARFSVPSYYGDFSCKGKDCRNCCCQGWKITLNQDEYFSLHSQEVPPEVKEKIDAYVGIEEHPSVEDYGRINLTYEGKCPFRRKKDGYCELQVLLGEKNIPSVCRYYPRAPRLYPAKECSISNSCEWVIEELIRSPNKLSFRKKTLSFEFDDDEKKEFSKDFLPIRNRCLSLIGDRRSPVNKRLAKISSYLGVPPLPSEEVPQYLAALKEATKSSYSLRDYAPNMDCDRNPSLRESLLAGKIPSYEIRAEKIFANHLLYVTFPFVDGDEDFVKAARGLEVIYAFYGEILLSSLKRYSIDKFVDLTSMFFRLAEHSNLYPLIRSITFRIEGNRGR